jgi:hypothetical protein
VCAKQKVHDAECVLKKRSTHAELAVKFCGCILSVRLKAIIFNIKKKRKNLKNCFSSLQICLNGTIILCVVSSTELTNGR